MLLHMTINVYFVAIVVQIFSWVLMVTPIFFICLWALWMETLHSQRLIIYLSARKRRGTK